MWRFGACALVLSCTPPTPEVAIAPGPGFVGCYAIEWDTKAHIFFPDTVALLADTLPINPPSIHAGERQVRLTTKEKDYYVGPMTLVYWRSMDDSIELGETEGFIGTKLQGHASTNGFTGVAHMYTDVVEPRQLVAFRARRAACLGFTAPAP